MSNAAARSAAEALLKRDVAALLREEDVDAVRAQAVGRKRARPIIMTTIAMAAGMLPSAYGVGDGGEFGALEGGETALAQFEQGEPTGRFRRGGGRPREHGGGQNAFRQIVAAPVVHAVGDEQAAVEKQFLQNGLGELGGGRWHLPLLMDEAGGVVVGVRRRCVLSIVGAEAAMEPGRWITSGLLGLGRQG